MSTKEKKDQDEIERKILRELREEILELKKQGKLYKFETAMDNAMAKFKRALKETSEEAMKEATEEDSVKKTAQNAEEQQE